uniref:BTB domain-containing protein n=1 Tax=Panagrolaimus sp. PS1159 TaxID=55785 RepID=A0AC35GLD7_9BILA
MLEYPFALEYTVSKDRLNTLKNSTNNEFLKSNKFAAFPGSGTEYFLQIFPNGHNDEKRGKTWVFLWVKLGNEKKVKAEYKLSIKSANWSSKLDFVFDKFAGWGAACCTTDELFDSSKNFIADGKLIVKVKGIFKIENPEATRKILKPKRKLHLQDLWKSGFEDFTIVADGKELQVHKNVLAAMSPVFSAMFKPHTKEAIESNVVIPDFSYDIVEKAVKGCYHHNIFTDLSTDECSLLLKFADKYDITILKDNIVEYLADKISVSNVCEISNCAIAGNALKLKSKCMDFLTKCLTMKYAIRNMEILDHMFLVAAITNFSCHQSQTL